MSETALLILGGLACYGIGWIQGALTGFGAAHRQHAEWLRTSNANLQGMIDAFNAHLVEREDYHRSIVAWVRGREKS